ncbi:MAG: ParM/StbA family protein [Cyanobacteria bacterium P01_A01_bin.15]
MPLTTALAATMPLEGTEDTSNERICSRFAFDGGNRFLKYFDASGTVQTVQSCIKPLADWEDIEPDQHSVVIENQGQRYVVGSVAAEMHGTSTHQGNKAQLAAQLLPVALEPGHHRNRILIGTLVVATPDVRDTIAVHHLEKLAGTYQFKRNGETITAKINRVEVVEECRAAWKYATNHGGYRWPDAKNAVLDLGGGTALARIFTRSGSPIRTAEVKLPGTYDLAKRIAAALQAKAEYSPDTSLIMDAIATGTYRIGQRLHFEGIYQQCRRQWLEEVRGALREAWATHMDELGEVLVIGGSAELARDFVESTNGRFKIPNTPNPQHISLYGMLEG